MVLGYPRLFPKGYRNQSDDPTCELRAVVWDWPVPIWGTVGFIDPADVNWMNDITLALNKAIKEKAVNAGVEYVDTFDAFAGHEQCSPPTSRGSMASTSSSTNSHPTLHWPRFSIRTPKARRRLLTDSWRQCDERPGPCRASGRWPSRHATRRSASAVRPTCW